MTKHDPTNQNKKQKPSLSIDWDAYGKMLEESDLSEEEKKDVISTLWSLVCNFVDLGLGVHPVQQVEGRIVSLAEYGLDDVVGCHQSMNITKQEEMTSASPKAGNEKGV